MVTTVTADTGSRSRALPGEGYDGVAGVSIGHYPGTGVLRHEGHAVHTAA